MSFELKQSCNKDLAWFRYYQFEKHSVYLPLLPHFLLLLPSVAVFYFICSGTSIGCGRLWITYYAISRFLKFLSSMLKTQSTQQSLLRHEKQVLSFEISEGKLKKKNLSLGTTSFKSWTFPPKYMLPVWLFERPLHFRVFIYSNETLLKQYFVPFPACILIFPLRGENESSRMCLNV